MRFIVVALLLFGVPAERSSVPLGLDAYRPVPETNPLTPEKIALGRRLFFDRRLSRDRSIACASCHDPRRAFTDGRPVAVGIEGRTGARNVPTTTAASEPSKRSSTSTTLVAARIHTSILKFTRFISRSKRSRRSSPS